MGVESVHKLERCVDCSGYFTYRGISFKYFTGSVLLQSSVSALGASTYPADDPDMLFFADAIQYAVARVHPAWTELSNYIQDYIQSVISGSDTAENAAKVCQDAIDAIEY